MTDFRAQKARLTKGTSYVAGGGGSMFDPGDLAKEEVPRLRGGALFAYLFRRFGYPDTGWDGEKSLVEYWVTTPMDDVFLEITPYMGGDFPDGREREWDNTVLMFGYCVSKAIEQQFYDCMKQDDGYDAWDAHPTRIAVNEALTTAMRDLLRPVYVRDVPINCYGAVDDTTPVSEEDEEDEEETSTYAETSNAAGYGIPRSFFETTERYNQFIDALIALGAGDIDKGVDAVVVQGKEIINARSC